MDPSLWRPPVSVVPARRPWPQELWRRSCSSSSRTRGTLGYEFGLGGGAGFPLCVAFGLGGVGAGAFVFKGGDVPSRGRVVPGQPPLFPPQVQVQHRAVSLQAPVRQLFNFNGNVRPVHQPVPGQLRPVILPRLVEPPVFRYSQRGVVLPFRPGVLRSGAAGGYLQHEVRRLALFADDVPVAGFVGRRVDPQGYQQVGKAPV